MTIKQTTYILAAIILILTSTKDILRAQVAAYPYTCDFENGLSGWKNEPGQPSNWIIGFNDAARKTNTKKKITTGPDKAHGGSAYAYVNLFDRYTAHTVTMSQTFDFSSLQNPILSLYIHNYWEGDNHDITFKVDVKESDDHYWNTRMIVTQDDGDQWHKLNACMSEYGGMSSVDIRISITPDKGCQNIAIDDISIEDFIISADVTHNTCYDYMDGVVTISPSCAGPEYKYSLTDGADYETSTEKSMTYTHLRSGLYNAKIVDITSECVAMRPSIKVTEPYEIKVATSIDDITCYGDKNGSLTVTATQAGEDETKFEYSIDGGNTFQSGNEFHNLPGNNYNVQVRNSKGCLSSTVVQPIGEDVLLEIRDIEVTHVTRCYGDESGVIGITIGYGNNAPITYSIDGGATESQGAYFRQLPAGEYHVTIIDKNKCKVHWPEPVTITEPPQLKIQKIIKNDVDGCTGDKNGSITFAITGGTEPYYTTIDGLIYAKKTEYTNLAAGTYHASIQDENYCKDNYGDITITQPDPLQITSIDATDVNTCHGDATGSLEITARGGTGDITYQLITDGAAQLTNPIEPSLLPKFDALKAGNYVPKITDAKGCQATYDGGKPFTINEPETFDIISSNAVDKEILCHGDQKGLINVLATGGTLPYTYTIDDYKNSVVTPKLEPCNFGSLGAGTYTIKAHDAHGCQATDRVHILKQPDPLVFTEVEATALTCYNDMSGSIAMEAEGGSPEYKFAYSIHGDNNWRDLLPRQVIDRLAADVYDVLVTDKYQCTTYYYNVEVSQPPKLELTHIIPFDVTLCYGDANGRIIIEAVGGTQPYQYSIDNGSQFQQSKTFDDLPAGNNYHILVKDQNGCETDGGTTLINQPAQVLIESIDYQDIHGCHGDKSGSIDFVASGGHGQLKYSITGYPQQLDGDFHDIPGGTYTLRVEDSRGCYYERQGVTINDPPAFEFAGETQITNNLCFDETKGEAKITVQGGMPIQAEFPYRFYLNPDPDRDIESIDPTCYDGIFEYLHAGHYKVVIGDAYDCRLSTEFDITEPELFEITGLDTTNVNTCKDDATGYIKANITGGIKPITFTCSSMSGYNKQNETGIFDHLRAAQYGITAEDANKCISQYYINITEPSRIQFDAELTNEILCHDAGEGEITVTASGGVGHYRVSIDGGVSYPHPLGAISGLMAGNYSVMVMDKNECTSPYSYPIRIDNPAALVLNASGYNVVCHEGNTGKIISYARGGTKPYEYSIDNVHWKENQTTFENLTDGHYTVFVRDFNNCTAESDAITITRPPNRAGFQVSEPQGCSPHSFTLTQDYDGMTTYTISNGDFIAGHIGSVSHVITNTTDQPQTYRILAELRYDSNAGCADTAYRYVTVYPQPKTDFRLADTMVVWPRNTAGIAHLTPNIKWAKWDFGDGTTSNEIDVTSHSYPTCGYYNIRLIESDGRCSDTLEHIFLIEGRQIQPSFATDISNGCEPIAVSFTSDSQNADSLVWDFGDGSPTVSGSTTTWHTYKAPGSYAATLTLYGDCGTSTTTSKTITVHPKPTASFEQNTDTIYEGQKLRVFCESSPTDKYIWDFGDGTPRQQGLATAEHEYKFDGVFDISLIVVTGNSCSDTAKVKNAVVVATVPIVVFPTAFTPNGDGLNDIFLPVHGPISTYEIIILNRNGVVVYKSNNIDEGWDGTRNGKPCLPGMYVYKVMTTLRDKTIHFQYGHVMMYR